MKAVTHLEKVIAGEVSAETHLEKVIANETSAVTYTEKVIAGEAPPITHLQKVIAGEASPVTHLECVWAGSTPEPTEHEYTGVVPYTFTANGEPLLDWSIYGNTVQSGTPSPQNPVMPNGCGDLEISGAKAGQYKIPISSAGQTTPVYLGEVETTRKIKKLVLDGTENWTEYGSGSSRFFYTSLSTQGYNDSKLVMSTHFQYTSGSSAAYSISLANNGTTLRIYDRETNWADATTFKSWLAAQYSAGNPVTVWYVLATPETAVVNEPLQKIGDYADSLTATQAGVEIPTNNGSTTIDVDTTVKPSEVYIKWKGV